MGILHEEEVGLTTKEALNRLHKDIEHVLNQFLSSQKSRRSKSWIRDAVHHTSRYTTVNWISASCLLLISISFMSAHIVDDTIFLVPQGVLIFIFLLLNITTELYDNKLRHNEVPNRVKLVLDKIRQETSRVVWSTENYPHLCSPYSPCITLQWTYRDNKLVNLPWSLLVKDDIILIRPGQVSPGYCEAVDKSNEYSLLHAKEVYGPSLQSANEVFSNPKARKPLEFRKYKLLETPYLNNLRVALEQSLDKPITQLNQQRHLVMIKITERFVLPIALITVYIINLVRYLYLHSYFGRGNAVDMFLIVPFSTVLPLLPVIFPIVWNMLNYLGLARFKTLFDATMKVKINENPFEEDHDKLLINDKGLKCSRRETLCNFLKVFLGQSDIMTRSSNVVHVLGSLTALCCVDKKGILSWPNPTAEKVFFLHNKGNLSQSSSLANLNDLSVDPDSSASTPKHNYQSEGSNAAIAEVLDLTHNLNDPFKLHFDDTKWHKHLNSLKPLGLAILLNTCNLETMEQYTSFCSHITCEAMYNEHLIPVTNRRCLCELAKEIGFIEQAQKVFNLEQQLFSYRHLQPEMVRRDYKYARSLHLSTKLKFPFPHMFAVVVKEISSGSIQLLSEGTADIILDSCVDYWDGHDLCTLTPADRKKVQDFYQRSSLTAYCTAFAYRPLNKIVSSKLSSMYLELPSDSRHLYLNQHSPSSMHWDCRSVLEPKIRTHYSQFYSTDSLLCSDTPCSDVSDADSCFEMQCNQVFIGMVTMQYQAIYDMVQLIEELERACIRFVHFSKENELRSRVFSEKMGLESGWNCHISLLSERNRGEAGQQDVKSSKNVTARTPLLNDASLRKSPSARRLLCSALPTYDVKCFHNFNSNLNSSRTMSFSAPSAINMDHSVVKFDTDHEHPQKVVSENNSNADVNNAMSQEQIDCQTTDTNVGTHDWQSLSCLTDSTEQSAPINFDMSNRAKLPRGIDKIRPHIEFIDNVPLLVSLFTDCTALVTREMLHIMQDYGEVVCVLGSSANFDNIGIFMQADASIAVEPLYPQVCQKEEPFKKIPDEKFISPTELSRSLNSIACSLSIRREDPNCIHHLIMEARDYTAHLWSAVQFWLCCCFTLSFTQLVASVFMLPSPLTTGQIMWFVCFMVPLLSTSLMCYKTNPDVMKKPRGKNQIIINMEVIFFILWCYGLKFVPTVFVAIASFVGILASHCVKTCDIHNCTCALFYIPVETDGSETLGGWVEMSYTLLISRQIIVLVVLLHFVTISVCFVHREYSLWNRSPHTNIFWLATITVLIILHSVYTILSCLDIHSRFEKLIQFNIPISVIAFAFTSPLVILITNEIIKQQEIRVNKRFQRRARLDFGTKLGMNSPF